MSHVRQTSTWVLACIAATVFSANAHAVAIFDADGESFVALQSLRIVGSTDEIVTFPSEPYVTGGVGIDHTQRTGGTGTITASLLAGTVTGDNLTSPARELPVEPWHRVSRLVGIIKQETREAGRATDPGGLATADGVSEGIWRLSNLSGEDLEFSFAVSYVLFADAVWGDPAKERAWAHSQFDFFRIDPDTRVRQSLLPDPKAAWAFMGSHIQMGAPDDLESVAGDSHDIWVRVDNGQSIDIGTRLTSYGYAHVPEPATLLLMLVAVMALLRLNRRKVHQTA